MKQEEINEAAEEFCNRYDYQPPQNRKEKNNITKFCFKEGIKYAQSKMYSEKDLKQFAFECVVKFLSNDDNKIEMKLVEVISDRLDTHFENFKKK